MFVQIDDEVTRDHSKVSGYVICKGCNQGIFKKSGCVAMKCRCGYKFCFKCGKKDGKCKHASGHGFSDN